MSDHHFWLSEAQFGRLEPLLPNKPRGVRRVDDRRVILGIIQVIGGAPVTNPARNASFQSKEKIAPSNRGIKHPILADDYGAYIQHRLDPISLESARRRSVTPRSAPTAVQRIAALRDPQAGKSI